MIRTAVPTDYAAFAALARELAIDEPPTSERWTTELARRTLVAEDDRNLLGYVYFQTIGRIGYVRTLAVTPRARGGGLGRELMTAAATVLRAAGVSEWHLNVPTDNAAAIHLYEQLGMRPEHRSTALRLRWDRLLALPGEAATVLPIAPAEEDEIERELGMLGGQIAMARRHRSHVLRQLRDESCAPVGFAAFDPAVPGARIFRVARPALAAALLGALRPHARHPDLALVLDDDDATTELLIANGATVKLRLLHYSGALAA